MLFPYLLVPNVPRLPPRERLRRLYEYLLNNKKHENEFTSISMASYFIINNELESNILFIYTLSSYKHAQIHDHGSVYECALSNTHRAYVGMTTEVFTSVCPPWVKYVRANRHDYVSFHFLYYCVLRIEWKVQPKQQDQNFTSTHSYLDDRIRVRLLWILWVLFKRHLLDYYKCFNYFLT